MIGGPELTVLHYVGGGDDRGGIVAVVRALAPVAPFSSLLGVNPGFRWRRAADLPTLELPGVPDAAIGLRTLWQTRAVARRAQAWLHGDPARIFHGRSRTGLLAALWLGRWNERQVVASVHCLGRQRWYYRHAAARLGPGLVWLGPAMKRHYGVGDGTWSGCVPDCTTGNPVRRAPRARAGLRVGCVGSLVPVKQWELVLGALARLPRDCPVSVIHAGGEDGSPASRSYAVGLRALAARIGVEARITWQGERLDLQVFHGEIDCLLVASRWEASSMAALEAAFAGVPLLAADASGTSDLIATAGAGWLFRADRAEDLAHQLEALARPGAVEQAPMRGKILQRYTAPVVAEQWREIYQRTLACIFHPHSADDLGLNA